VVILLVVLAWLAVALPIAAVLFVRGRMQGRIDDIRREHVVSAASRTVLLGVTTTVRVLVEFEPLPAGANGRLSTWATLPHTDEARQLIECWQRDRTAVRVKYLQQGSEIAAADDRLGVTWLSTTAR
jgi:hypothetical protein